jgi:CDP-diacylglycerol--serine O-phosphatidyltransferase
LVVANPTWLEGNSWSVLVVIALVLVSCYLLISELPMFALKFKQWGWKDNKVKYCFMALAAFCVVFFGILEAWWIIISLYFIISVVLYLNNKEK